MAQTVDEVMAAYERTMDTHDLQGALGLIDDEAVYFFSNEAVHVGKQAVEEALRRNFELIEDEAYAIGNLSWLARSESAAACVYDFSWSGTIGGRPASGTGRGTTVLQRAGGEWKVVHEHLSRGRFAAG